MTSPADYFSPNYFSARDRFRGLVERNGGRMESLGLDAKGPGNEELAIDIASFGSEEPQRILLHSSGLHGVEGFAGSAIQLHLLEDLPRLPPDCALLVAHVLNPYGMAWLRRVNEDNVDLNRNFLENAAYTGAPDIYAQLDSFLNPKSLPQRDFYFLKTLRLLFRYGMPALKQAVAGGQWDFPRGLFFGGKRLQDGPAQYRAFLTRRLAGARQVIAIDVHTGLGKYGQETLLVEPPQLSILRSAFGDHVTPLESTAGSAYRVRGGLQSMIFQVGPENETYFVGQEFGTYSGVRVLQAMRQENRWHHYGEGTLDHPTKATFKRAFCPDDNEWRKAVLKQGQELLRRALRYLESRGAAAFP